MTYYWVLMLLFAFIFNMMYIERLVPKKRMVEFTDKVEQMLMRE